MESSPRRVTNTSGRLWFYFVGLLIWVISWVWHRPAHGLFGALRLHLSFWVVMLLISTAVSYIYSKGDHYQRIHLGAQATLLFSALVTLSTELMPKPLWPVLFGLLGGCLATGLAVWKQKFQEPGSKRQLSSYATLVVGLTIWGLYLLTDVLSLEIVSAVILAGLGGGWVALERVRLRGTRDHGQPGLDGGVIPPGDLGDGEPPPHREDEPPPPGEDEPPPPGVGAQDQAAEGASPPESGGAPTTPPATSLEEELLRQRYGDQLTEREFGIAVLAVKGFSTNDIAKQQFLTVNTVKTHLRHIYRKTQSANRNDLYRKLMEQG